MRGLKHLLHVDEFCLHESHPARVRGLKPIGGDPFGGSNLSHPARVRGLKPHLTPYNRFVAIVAPRAGAWIETSFINSFSEACTVAPRAGAWIETLISTSMG